MLRLVFCQGVTMPARVKEIVIAARVAQNGVEKKTPGSELVIRVLAAQSIRQFPLHFPSRASPCAITFQLDSTSPFFMWLVS